MTPDRPLWLHSAHRTLIPPPSPQPPDKNSPSIELLYCTLSCGYIAVHLPRPCFFSPIWCKWNRAGRSPFAGICLTQDEARLPPRASNPLSLSPASDVYSDASVAAPAPPAADQVYPIGIPLLYAYILWINRESLNPCMQQADASWSGSRLPMQSEYTAKESPAEVQERIEKRRQNPDLVPSMFLWKDFGERSGSCLHRLAY